MAVPFAMNPSTDQTGSFAINLDLGEIGALQVTARKVWLMQLGDASRLKAIAATVRRHLNLVPVEEPSPTPEPAIQKKLLILYESSADAITAKNIKLGRPPIAVITLPAFNALKTPDGIEKIASALRNRQIAGCLLIATSADGPAAAVAAEWNKLENAVHRNGMLDIVTLRQNGRMRIVKSNVTRLAQLDDERAAEGLAPQLPDEQKPDPDPW